MKRHYMTRNLSLIFIYVAVLSVSNVIAQTEKVERDYVERAKLTEDQEKEVISLAIKCGLKKPIVRISTHNMFPTPFRGIRVQGVEKINGREVTTQILSMSYSKWLEPGAKPSESQTREGDFWAGKPYTQKKIILKIKGKEVRTSSIQGMTLEECEMILVKLLDGEYETGAQINKNLLQEVDWNKPSGFFKRGESLSIGFLHKVKDSGFFDLQISRKNDKIIIEQMFQAIP